jgi:hypothetical protein
MTESSSASESASASEEASATSAEASAPSPSASEVPDCEEEGSDLETRDFDDMVFQDEDDLEEMWVYEDEVPEGWVIVE